MTAELKSLSALLRNERVKIDEAVRKVTITMNRVPIAAIPTEWAEMSRKNVYLRLCTLDPVSRDKTILNVVATEGGEVEPFTSDRELRIIVIEGEYLDPVSGVTYHEGDTQTIPPGVLHGIKSEHALLNFIWRPPYPEGSELCPTQSLDGSDATS